MTDPSDHELLTSVWDHLDDLRATLIRILVIIIAGICFCFCFYQPIFQVLTAGWQTENGLTRYPLHYERVINHQNRPAPLRLPEGAMTLDGDNAQTYQLEPGHSLDYQIISSNNLLIFGPLDGLVLTLKVCFWMSLALTSPFWGWTLMQFVIPGLRREEKSLMIPFLTGSVLCLALGAAVAYTITLPLSNRYLSAFNATIGLNAWSLNHYIDYTLLLFTGHAVAFELGLILFMLVHLGWSSVQTLVEKRRYMILLAFILGALLTPPDVASQILLAVPLIILYELAILYGKIKNRDKG